MPCQVLVNKTSAVLLVQMLLGNRVHCTSLIDHDALCPLQNVMQADVLVLLLHYEEDLR